MNNHNEQGDDHRSQPRWSAGKKADAVLRLAGGHPHPTLVAPTGGDESNAELV
jgi:hypothetical protein